MGPKKMIGGYLDKRNIDAQRWRKRCDCCDNIVERWYRITPQSPLMSIADLLEHSPGKNVCEECYKQFISRELLLNELQVLSR